MGRQGAGETRGLQPLTFNLRPLVECVPNFSEGRRPEVIGQIVAALKTVQGVEVLHVDSDWDHNRSVVTFVGAPDAVGEAAFRAVQMAQRLIDLGEHQGAHPRLGATDVLPFVPLHSVTMAECIALARAIGQRIGDELGLPVYLYEHAATRPDRRNLADVRRGEYEGLKQTLGRNPARDPDFGPHVLTPAGAVAVGARPVLIAYNVYLDTADIHIARAVAKAIRESNGGLPTIKALGLLVNGQAQVSINIVDYHQTGLYQLWTRIVAEAARHGTTPMESEVVGLVPEDALIQAAKAMLHLDDLPNEQLLERRVQQALHNHKE